MKPLSARFVFRLEPIRSRPRRLYRGYIFDLDGTTYLGDSLLPAAGETITALRALDCRVAFLAVCR